jgi:hypothetical protein
MRVKLQGTLDRAVLAATAFDGDDVTAQDKKDIVIEYFTKAGLVEYLDMDSLYIGSAETFDQGTVTARARANVPTIFMDAVGIDFLAAPANVAATIGQRPIEIVLVLDVSGSMNDPAGGGKSRIEALQDSAEDFVKAVLENPDNAEEAQKLTTIAIVPYSWNVNMGTDITKYYGKEAGWINGTDVDTGCIAFLGNPTVIGAPTMDVSDYGPESTENWSVSQKRWHAHWLTAEMDPTLPWPRTPYSDSYSTRFDRNGNEISSVSNSALDCMTNQNQRGLGFTNDPDTLDAAIERLVASGSTSMDVGMKWANHLINPSFRPVMNQIIGNGEFVAADGTAAEDFRDRPLDYDVKVDKYIVLMTDGDNNAAYTLKDGYRVGMSPIWVGTSSSTTRYSIFDPARAAAGQPAYYVPKNSSSTRWRTTPYGNSPVNLTWKVLWERETVSYVAYEIYAKWLNAKNSSKSIGSYFNDLYDDVRGDYNNDNVGVVDTSISLIQRAGWTSKDIRLQAACDVHDGIRSVKVFTIAFRDDISDEGVPFENWHRGEKSLYNCATTPSFYYPAEDEAALGAAFAAIAGEINKLRLTQ